MERHGSDDLPSRVKGLEREFTEIRSDFHQLRIESQETRTDLAGIKADLHTFSGTLHEVAQNLDDQRTAKPNLLGGAVLLVAIISATFTYSELRFAPVYREMNAATEERKAFSKELMERAYVIGQSSARLDHVEETNKQTDARLLIVESNRYTKQDAQRTEDSLCEEMGRLWDAVITEHKMHREAANAH